ncbi:MAG: nucleoside triphosphate pyrophosphohydrolase [Chloroflexi bacterium]|nr:nucleoside triphosphate pyrophosphohydrolase [Chloroflexota bacterium]
MTITILGLGPGDPRHLTREAWETLTSASEIYLRTARHPTAAGLPASLAVHSFDHLYESAKAFEAVYEAIAAEVLALGARSEGVLYAVPGHPLVGEATVALIRERAAGAGLPVKIIPGLSFVAPCLAALGYDALSGLAIADALDLAARHHPPFPPDTPALVAQLYSTDLASEVKLTLMNQYPDEHEVALIHAAGTPDESVERLPLYEIDRSPRIAHLTALFVPALPRPSAFETFQNTIAHLRAPDGCPWDRAQTHRSLRSNLLEETYEVLAALDAEDEAAMREEFGDLLLQIVLQSQIAVEAGEFSLAEVIAGINEKIVRRHPHVFGDLKVNGIGDVLKNWEALKSEERNNKGEGERGLLEGIPPALPALAQAEAYSRRAARVGFDWPEVSGVIAKGREEMAGVQAATDAESRADEMGDLLFAIANYARWLDVDPEAALRAANAKFAARFAKVESAAKTAGRDMAAMSLEELDALWEDAKAR